MRRGGGLFDDRQALGDPGEAELDVLAAGLAERLGERRSVVDLHAQACVGLSSLGVPGDVDLGFTDDAALVVDAQEVAPGELGFLAAWHERAGKVGLLRTRDEHAVFLLDGKVAADEAEFAHRCHTSHLTGSPYGAVKTSVRATGLERDRCHAGSFILLLQLQASSPCVNTGRSEPYSSICSSSVYASRSASGSQ